MFDDSIVTKDWTFDKIEWAFSLDPLFWPITLFDSIGYEVVLERLTLSRRAISKEDRRDCKDSALANYREIESALKPSEQTSWKHVVIRGLVKHSIEKLDVSLDAFAESIEAAESEEQQAISYNCSARVLLDCENAGSSVLAVESAKNALYLSPSCELFWVTLAVAYFKTEQFCKLGAIVKNLSAIAETENPQSVWNMSVRRDRSLAKFPSYPALERIINRSGETWAGATDCRNQRLVRSL